MCMIGAVYAGFGSGYDQQTFGLPVRHRGKDHTTLKDPENGNCPGLPTQHS
jgi:hypothetical protein